MIQGGPGTVPPRSGHHGSCDEPVSSGELRRSRLRHGWGGTSRAGAHARTSTGTRSRPARGDRAAMVVRVLMNPTDRPSARSWIRHERWGGPAPCLSPRTRPWGRSPSGNRACPGSGTGTPGVRHRRSRPCVCRGCAGGDCSTPAPMRPWHGTRVASTVGDSPVYPMLTPAPRIGPPGQARGMTGSSPSAGHVARRVRTQGDAGWLRGQTTRRRRRCSDGGSKHRSRASTGDRSARTQCTPMPPGVRQE